MKVLITGATSGLGKQLALDYARTSHDVIACGRNAGALEALECQCPDNISTLQFDITSAEACKTALSNINAIDLVILNAGTCIYAAPLAFKEGHLKSVWDVNIGYLDYFLPLILPKLTRPSKLVFLSSLAHYMPFSLAAAYGSSKAALNYLAKSLSVDLAEHGIAVHLVSPGFIDTPLTRKNTFSMPWLQSPVKASKIIRRGIEKNTQHIRFPVRLWFILALVSMFPMHWQVGLAKKLKETS